MSKQTKDVNVIMLTTGERLVAEVVKYKKKKLVLNNVLEIITIQSSNGSGMTSVEWLLMDFFTSSEFEIKTRNIIITKAASKR